MKISTKFFIGFFFAIIFSTNLFGMEKYELGRLASPEDINKASYDMNNKFVLDEIVILTRSNGAKVYGKITEIDDQGIYTVSYDKNDPLIYKYFKYYPDEKPATLDRKEDPHPINPMQRFLIVSPVSQLGKIMGMVPERKVGELASEEDKNLVTFDSKNTFKLDEIVVIKTTMKYGTIRNGIVGQKSKYVVNTESGTSTLSSDQLGKFPTDKEPTPNKPAPKQTTPAKTFSSLTAWSEACFKEYPEYTESGVGKTPILSWEQFYGQIKTFISTFQSSDFGKKETWMREQSPDASFFELKTERTEYSYPFVQKKIIPAGSKVCFIGDFHGSLHSLLRLLLRMVWAGYLNDDFKIIEKNFYIVFLGDLVDRGHYSIEVLWTILMVKLANWDNVVICRGNHEDYSISLQYGLLTELQQRFSDIEKAFEQTTQVFDFFAMALFLGSGDSFVQCSHGGIEPHFDPKPLIESNKVYEKIDEKSASHVEELKKQSILTHEEQSLYIGFNWSDFQQTHVYFYQGHKFDTGAGKIHYNKPREGGYFADVQATDAYLKINTAIKAFFRGHQDKIFGFKMLFKNVIDGKSVEVLQPTFPGKARIQIGTEISTLDCGLYDRGPFHWTYVASEAEQEDETGFLISNHAPIFTFTSATETQEVPHDCFGIVTTAEKYTGWRLKPYEFYLEPSTKRDGLFVSLSIDDQTNPKDRLLQVGHAYSQGAAKEPILPDALVKKAKLNISEAPKEKPDTGKKTDEKLAGALEKLKESLAALSTTLSEVK